MGKLLTAYKDALFNELSINVNSNNSIYYAFAANPISDSNTDIVEQVTEDPYSTEYFIWSTIFGKRIDPQNMTYVVQIRYWTANTVYDMWDDRDKNLFKNNNYYVVCKPIYEGGDYTFFVCIYNNGGIASIGQPSKAEPITVGNSTKPGSIHTGDGYIWRYVGKCSTEQFMALATDTYIPVYSDEKIRTSAYQYSGVEVVKIVSGGSDYNSYHNGTLSDIIDSVTLQIPFDASSYNNFYTGNAIYIYNENENTSQLNSVKQYISNSIGNFVILDTDANTEVITPNKTKYRISPRVVFSTDGVTPKAYSVVDPIVNSISEIVILDIGSGITRAEAWVVSNTVWGSGANLHAIAPPPGGHGSSPQVELNMKGFAVGFTFSNNENFSIPTDVTYNKIGIVRNPCKLTANNQKGEPVFVNTYNQVIKANTYPSYQFEIGQPVYGQNSGSKGIVTLSNTTQVHMIGDKNFANTEGLLDANGKFTTLAQFKTLGEVYTEDLKPLYVQNINKVKRSNTTAESYKFVVEI